MKKLQAFFSLLLLCTLLLTACAPAATAEVPTATISAQQSALNTQVAALSTEVASLKASAAAPSATPEEPTQTSTAGTASPLAGTPMPAVHAAGLCDFATFVGDINIPDGTMIPPNTPFTKTWAIKNTGSCTWTTDYSMIYVGGEPMGSPLTVPMLDKDVAPGETAHISIKFTAPPDNKIHRSFWKFRNAKGGIFGVIDAQNKESPIWTEIRTGLVYSFIDNMCLATWKTGGGRLLTCPGSDQDTDGAVYRLNNSQWSDGVIENDPVMVLLTPPGQGSVIGQYPPVIVPDQSNLVTRIGCLKEDTACSAHVKITYSVDGGPEQAMIDQDISYQDGTAKISLYLAKYSLFRHSVSFIFNVTSNSDAGGDKVFFFVPQLQP